MQIKEKIKKTWLWLKKNVFNREMLIWIIIAEILFWSPCIVTGFLAVFINKWWWTAFGAIIVFWSGPFTPAVPLQIALAIALKKSFSNPNRNKPYCKVLKRFKSNKKLLKGIKQ